MPMDGWADGVRGHDAPTTRPDLLWCCVGCEGSLVGPGLGIHHHQLNCWLGRDSMILYCCEVKSSTPNMGVPVRDRVAIIQTLIFSSPQPYAVSGDLI